MFSKEWKSCMKRWVWSPIREIWVYLSFNLLIAVPIVLYHKYYTTPFSWTNIGLWILIWIAVDIYARHFHFERSK